MDLCSSLLFGWSGVVGMSLSSTYNHRESTFTSIGKIYSLLNSCKTVITPLHTAVASPADPRLVSWSSKPVEGILCLNVDGSLLGNPSSAGYGGLIRDNNGVLSRIFTGLLLSIVFYS
jgi:hypothetical protein